MFLGVLFFFKQRTAYEMRISDWSSDVCSSDLGESGERVAVDAHHGPFVHQLRAEALVKADRRGVPVEHPPFEPRAVAFDAELGEMREQRLRSEEHTSELQSLMRISYAVFCLKKKKNQQTKSIQ